MALFFPISIIFWVHKINSYVPLIDQFLVHLSHEVATAIRLKLSEHLSQSNVPHILEATQHTGLEEDLAVTHSVLTVLQL